jgi:hypothetical protein
MKAAFSLCLSLLFLLCACGTPDHRAYTIGHSGETIHVERGDHFKVRLLANQSTRMAWRVTELDPGILQSETPEVENRIPTGGLARLTYYRFDFKATARGSSPLRIELFAPGSDTPVETFTLTVVVD